MNRYLVGLVAVLLVFGVFILINKYWLKFRSKKQEIIKRIVLLLILFITWEIPFDRLIFKFETVDKIFSYYYPRSEIIKEYVYDDYAFVFYKKDRDSVGSIYFDKNKKGYWTYNSISHLSNVKTHIIDNYIFVTSKIPNKDVTFVEILYSTFANTNQNITISDSLESDFETLNYDKNSYAALMKADQKLPKDYHININGKDYYLFK